MNVELIQADSKAAYAQATILLEEYAAWLNIDLCFQNFSAELEKLDVMYALPYGAIILAKADGELAGCVAIRKIDLETAELKRMYVRTAFRQHGLGSRLLDEAIVLAQHIGYKKIRLDTLDTMGPAIDLYIKRGFYQIAPYYHNPENNALYFEKVLR